MNKGIKIGLIFLVVILVITSILQVNQTPKLNWYETLDPKSKSPFGVFLLKENIQNFVNYKDEISIYDSIDKLDAKKSAIILLSNNEFYTEQRLQEILNFVDNGGTLFASGRYLHELEYELNINTLEINEFSNDYVFDWEVYQNELIKGDQHFQVKELDNRYDTQGIITDNEDVKSEILGYARVNNIDRFPNFSKIKYGKGYVYFHSHPRAFTNYYLMQNDSYLYAKEALNYLDGKEVYWLTDREKESDNILRFILSNKELAFAWRILFACLILFLIFKSKREQKAIPIVTPEENHSVEFAKTIGSLYYENGSPANMIQKKIEYFLFTLRKHFTTDTSDLTDPRFVKLFANKANLTEEEASEILNKIIRYQNQENMSLDELKMMNNLLDEYKKKANIK